MKTFIFTLFFFFSALSAANETQNSANWVDAFTNKRDAGGYLSVGIAVQNQQGLYQSSGIKLKGNVHGAYYFENGFLLEFPGLSDKFESQFALGYNIANLGNWEFDALLSMAHGEIKYNAQQDGFSKEASPYFGLRAMGTIADLDAMFVVGTNSNKMDYSGGVYAAAWLAKSWNINNWTLYSSIGAQYRNDAILDYYYGVPESAQVTEPFQATGGFNYLYKLGVKKPLDEHWLIEGFFSYTHYASSIVDSPYSQNILKFNEGRSDQGSLFNLSINYVF
ncbi:MipA/OmpV family protein [Pseudoalteromonas xiamenensis]|uniref:MipA/OmpV family protein n=1 Tax=Pseudoalteromonas xiamenensis TaxID=882626 RepID=A0A975HLN0_9GAMM|nr:MipA/OmpV family protein [Pseudoalteromonas xiamenensis]QTH72266.1 MipA/OmpV family protein [Pseudoalteromonas xiamenensis]